MGRKGRGGRREGEAKRGGEAKRERKMEEREGKVRGTREKEEGI